MEPSKQPLSKLLTIEGTQESYRIPKYQRPYSWSTRDWAQLLEDIDDNSGQTEGHFMGSMICIDKSSGAPGEPRVYELVDGQQRLTTLSCLLVATWSALNELLEGPESSLSDDLDPDELEDLRKSAKDIQRKIIRERWHPREVDLPAPSTIDAASRDFYIGRRKRTDVYARLIPSAQDLNRDDYIYALSEFGLLPEISIEQPRNWGNRRIARCLRFFAESIPREITALKLLAQRINALIFIHIKVDTQADAFRLFEAINNRGVPLSALDIIKNAMLAALESQESGSIDVAFDIWSSMTDRLGSDTGIHESYLRHFYNAFQLEPGRRVQGSYRATRSTLIHIYEQLIKTDAQQLLHDLASRAAHYEVITNPDDAELPVARKSALQNLARVEARPSYQFLLYLLTRETAGACKSADVNRIIDFVARYFVRRNLTGFPVTNRLDAIFINLIAKCEEAIASESGAITYDLVRDELKSGSRADATASDEALEAALADHIYWYNPTMTRYLLCRFVETRASKEQQIDLWRRDDKGRYVWTIEHILPQGTPLKSTWVKMLQDGRDQLAGEIQEEYFQRIGNLTLSAYNSNLSNAGLAEKQRKVMLSVAGEKVSIGYQNGMLLNDLPFNVRRKKLTLGTTDAWGPDHIDARGAVLIEAMLREYRL